MKKISLLLFLIITVFSFSEIVREKDILIKNINQGINFTNVTPYPSYFGNYFEVDDYTIHYNSKPFWIMYGKYTTDWGDFERNLYLSDSLPYVVGLTGGFENKGVKIIFGVYDLNFELSNEEWLIQKTPGIDGNSDRRGLDGYKGYAEPYKTYIIHRIEFDSLQFLRVSFSEINLVGGKIPDLVDVNPFGILHNTYGEGYSNTILGADFSLIPIKKLQIYGQFAMDDFVVPDTEAGATNYKPTSLAYALGGRYVYRLDDYYLAPKFEYYKVYTWMYNRWQKLLKFTADYDGVEIPVGFDYGNDMEGFLFGFDLLFDWNLKVKFLSEFYKKGAIDLNTSYSDERKQDYENWAGPYPPVSDFIKLSLHFEINYWVIYLIVSWRMTFIYHFNKYFSAKIINRYDDLVKSAIYYFLIVNFLWK